MDNAVPAKVQWDSIVKSLAVVIMIGGVLLKVLIRNSATSPVLLAVACGTGAQLLATTIVSILFASMGFMSPTRRGHFRAGSILIFAIMGIVTGYVSARFSRWSKDKIGTRNGNALHF
jgi:transmembrane 9 superfamily protein 2/4